MAPKGARWELSHQAAAPSASKLRASLPLAASLCKRCLAKFKPSIVSALVGSKLP